MNKSIVDYSKITLCPAMAYESYCCVCGKCENCPYYKENNDDCEGCGANFKNKPNTKERFVNKQNNNQCQK